MNEFEQILWKHNRELSDEILLLTRALALVLISPNHEAAIQASKDAFAQRDLTCPFKEEVAQSTEEVVAA